LRRGKMLTLPSGSHTGAFVRTTENSAVIVAFNNNSVPETLHFKLSEPLAAQSQWFNRLADNQTVFVKDGVIEFQLPPRSAAILTPQPPLITQEKGKTQARSDLRLP
jgi:hypothetical protein